jgi:hypothetical protein
MDELTASLAHEIKQPIGAAVTNAEACLRLINRREPDLPEAREAALEMVKDARRAADIIEPPRPHNVCSDASGTSVVSSRRTVRINIESRTGTRGVAAQTVVKRTAQPGADRVSAP